jgi:hypothetical protein
MTYLVIAIIVLLIQLSRQRKEERAMLEHLTLRPRAGDPDRSAPSIHALIMEQAGERPEGPLDYSPFPLIPAEDGGHYIPGARDILDRSEKGPKESERLRIAATIRGIRSRHITDATTLELYVRDTDPHDHYHGLLNAFPKDGATPKVRELFQEMAFIGHDYNAVKWGIVVGSIGATMEELERLADLARHAELTVHVCRGLLGQRKRNPGVVDILTDLLAITDQWGFFQVYHYVAGSGLLDDHEVQRAAIVHGMRNGGDARSGLTSLFLGRLDLPRLFEMARHDEELAEGLMTMIEEMLLHPEPPGTLASNDEGEELVGRIMPMIEALPASINKARGLRALCIALGVETLAWPSRQERFDAAYEAYIETVSPEILTGAIRDDYRRVDALLMIAELGIEPLLPVVFDDFRRHPHPMNIEVLGRLGEGEHLHAIFDALPDAEEVARRTAIVEGEDLSGDLLQSSGAYAAIVRHIGKLEGPAAIARIKSAAIDFHPWVRAAAMTAMMSIQRWTLDTESCKLVQAGLEDQFDFVREAARTTAAYHNLKVTIDGTSGLILSEDFGISLN